MSAMGVIAGPSTRRGRQKDEADGSENDRVELAFGNCDKVALNSNHRLISKLVRKCLEQALGFCPRLYWLGLSDSFWLGKVEVDLHGLGNDCDGVDGASALAHEPGLISPPGGDGESLPRWASVGKRDGVAESSRLFEEVTAKGEK